MVIATPSEIWRSSGFWKVATLVAVRIPDVLLVEDLVLGHPVLAVLVLDVSLVLGEPVHSIEPRLPVVLSKDILGVADLAGDVILHT